MKLAYYLSIPTEHEEQVALFDWAAKCGIRELDLLFAIPNAGAGAQRGQAGKMKAEGVKRGVPDTMLPVRRGQYAGLFIEMKRLKGSTISIEQREWMNRLQAQGYRAIVAYGWMHAAAEIKTYLALPPLTV